MTGTINRATFTFDPDNSTNQAGGTRAFERLSKGTYTVWDDQNNNAEAPGKVEDFYNSGPKFKRRKF
mgnify:CR=1 FL=1